MRKQLLTAAFAAVLAASTAIAGAQVYVRVGPPAPRHEVVPVAPHPGWVWQPGYHRWDGAHYVWVPGAYAAPPYEHARWIPGHWANGPRGYYWIEGHWVR
jgi:hypothetical protein